MPQPRLAFWKGRGRDCFVGWSAVRPPFTHIYLFGLPQSPKIALMCPSGLGLPGSLLRHHGAHQVEVIIHSGKPLMLYIDHTVKTPREIIKIQDPGHSRPITWESLGQESDGASKLPRVSSVRSGRQPYTHTLEGSASQVHPV